MDSLKSPEDLLEFLRANAGLPEAGPGSDLQIWREGGTNATPTWTELKPDWGVASWGRLGLEHGDLLVVQEAEAKLPEAVAHTRTGPQWIKE